jgi:hypothetical protein
MSPSVSQELPMSSSTALPLPTISPEVRAFAAENGVEPYLPNVVALARRLFPRAAMHIYIEGDPELAYNWEIVFEVRADGLEQEEQIQLERQWTRELFQQCPATHVHLFCLSLRHSA